MTRPHAGMIAVLWLVLAAEASGQSFGRDQGPADTRARFAVAIDARDVRSAVGLAELLLSGTDDTTLLDEVTYRLAAIGARSEAAGMLLRAYSFNGADTQVRELLVRRLFHLLGESGATPPNAGLLEPLRSPLDAAHLRGLQGAFWAFRDDCAAVVAVLGDASPEYGHDDLLRLGDCVRESSPSVARDAYARAHAMQPGGAASRALAYHAHALGDYPTAVATWREIGVEQLTHDDLRGATTSAIAAGDAAQAQAWLEALSVRSGVREGDAQVAALSMDLGYLHLREQRSRAARTAFERAWKAGRDPRAAEQLAYLTQRLHDNAAARLHARNAIDAGTDARRPELRDAREAAGRLFALRRLHEDLGRRISVSLDGWSGPRSGTSISASQPGQAFSSYTQLEVDYRLGRQPIRDGRTLSLFGRAIADGGSPGSPWPTDNATAGVGLRWKPLRSRVFYLAAEGQAGLENRDYRDVLVRASASLFNGGSHGDDWHPSGTGWFAQNLYLDAAHFMDAGRTSLTADYRAGYHGKTTGNQTMEPYGRVQVNGLRAQAFARDVRGGLGIRWNLWYGASRYDAPAHKLSLGVEYQKAFDTYLTGTRSVFFTLGTRW